MLQLSSRKLRVLSKNDSMPPVVRVSTNLELPTSMRSTEALLVEEHAASLPTGFRAYLLRRPPAESVRVPENCFVLPDALGYLADGDVIRIAADGTALAVIYRKQSPSNSLLTTERCNHFCLMCSQPPKTRDDSYIIDELLAAIPLFDVDTREIGITGGEPTLLGPRFIDVLRCLRNYLPSTAVHVLSNGRRFIENDFVEQIAALRMHDIMFGIPLYADVAEVHDYVVQAKGAFDETIRGILNLKRSGIRVEIRFVIHRETYARLPQFAEFIARNLVLVDHVALMGLEPIGFAKANAETLWIDPVDYQPQLVAATETLRRAHVNVSIYNHQLCVLDRRAWSVARKSISDWKNEYLPQCAQCSMKPECGGFFSSALTMHSQQIAPIATSTRDHA